MPITYLAHQAPVLAIKRRWPAFDGTALALGSMAPDWAYVLNGTPLQFDGHTLMGIVAFCVPAAVVAALVLRRVAPVLFAYGPNPPQLPVRRLRALGSRRPPLAATVAGAAVGALTHVLWDMFTHDDRWGARHIGWLRSVPLTIGAHTVTGANVLQYLSHVLGSIGAVLLLAGMLRSGAWGDPPAARGGRPRFVAIAAAGVIAAGAWAAIGAGLPLRVNRLALGTAAGLVVASLACRRVVDEER